MSDMSAITARDFRDVLGCYPTGVCVVTSSDEGARYGMAVGSFTSISLDPRLVGFFPDKSSTSWPRIARAGSFCVNILGEDQEAVCRAFAVSGGDKFDGVEWSPGITGSPLIDGSLATVECTLGAIYEGGDHELVTGHVVDMEIGKG